MPSGGERAGGAITWKDSGRHSEVEHVHGPASPFPKMDPEKRAHLFTKDLYRVFRAAQPLAAPAWKHAQAACPHAEPGVAMRLETMAMHKSMAGVSPAQC